MQAFLIQRSVTAWLVFLFLMPLAGLVKAESSLDSGGMEVLERLFGGIQSGPDLLPPEKAFTVDIAVKDATTIVGRFKPEKGYYLYKDRVTFKVTSPASVSVAEVLLPKGEVKNDPTFGTVEVFHTPFNATVKLNRSKDTEVNGQLQFTYQGCSDQGVCYPPIEKTFEYVLPAVLTASVSSFGASVESQVSSVQSSSAPSQSKENTASIFDGWFDASASTALFEQKSAGWIIAGFFLLGILLSLTPCVWPMFPILSGIIAGQGTNIGKRRAFWLSISYVLGMAITYAVVGVIAGLTGSLLSTELQTPWALAAIATLFVLLALSMFGFYELQLPASLQTRLQPTGSNPTRSTVAVFSAGAISAIVVGPCIAAPLAAALLYIGQTQDELLGAAALFSLALGKGVPLVIVGTSLSAILPRSGIWMESIKRFVGVLLLATALWTVSPYLPMPLIMGAAAAMLVMNAVYLRALDPLPIHASFMARAGKGVGTLALLLGMIYLVGATSQSQDFFRPLSAFTATAASTGGAASTSLPFETISSVDELERKLQQEKGRYVMLDFYADWCVSCKEMEHSTFSDPAVRARLQNVALFQADVTKSSAEDKALLARFGLFGPPGIIFFDKQGQEIKGQRVIGFLNANRFTQLLDRVMQ